MGVSFLLHTLSLHRPLSYFFPMLLALALRPYLLLLELEESSKVVYLRLELDWQ